MENDPFDQLEDNDDNTPISPARKALQGTLLGMFLETKERRYLVAILLYLIAFVLFAGVIVYGFSAFTNGNVMKDGNHNFYGKLFTIVCWIGACISTGAFCARRYAMGFQAGLVTAFVIVLTIYRP
ncbi:hypothetical protein [Teredinibacter purpureus]|uniref:hypothetical protein n=1 Tax=Teredinibacter purpureus TaxID=2731756 RepID=UPI0005F772FB|nr:hypothetical protein [Teredinibacter purpureus]